MRITGSVGITGSVVVGGTWSTGSVVVVVGGGVVVMVVGDAVVGGGVVVTVRAGGAGAGAPGGPIVAITVVGAGGMSVIAATCGPTSEGEDDVPRLVALDGTFVAVGSGLVVGLEVGVPSGNPDPDGAITVGGGGVVVVDEPLGTGASVGTVSCANAT